MADKPKKLIRVVCPYCGSENVTIDATADWDYDQQKWTLCGTQDTVTCQECERESYGENYAEPDSHITISYKYRFVLEDDSVVLGRVARITATHVIVRDHEDTEHMINPNVCKEIMVQQA